MKLVSRFGNTSLSRYIYIQFIPKCVYSPLIMCFLQQKVSHISFLIDLTESRKYGSSIVQNAGKKNNVKSFV